MGARLAKTIVKELRIEVAEQIFHSDLITFLKRMKSTKWKFHTYVGNQVREVLKSLSLISGVIFLKLWIQITTQAEDYLSARSFQDTASSADQISSGWNRT